MGLAFFHKEFWECLIEKVTFGQRLEGGAAEPGLGRPGLKKGEGMGQCEGAQEQGARRQGYRSELVGIKSHS